MFNTILVPLDGSNHANHALTVAMDLAEKYSAELVLLTVFQPVSFSTEELNISATDVLRNFTETQKECAEQLLTNALHHVKDEHPTLHVTPKIAVGRVTDEIIATVEKESIDLIVMGSRGLGGIKQLVLGSVSDRVADTAPCPVLIVR
jgi:nucleotide-binding universal stress UspA family protein